MRLQEVSCFNNRKSIIHGNQTINSNTINQLNFTSTFAIIKPESQDVRIINLAIKNLRKILTGNETHQGNRTFFSISHRASHKIEKANFYEEILDIDGFNVKRDVLNYETKLPRKSNFYDKVDISVPDEYDGVVVDELKKFNFELDSTSELPYKYFLINSKENLNTGYSTDFECMLDEFLQANDPLRVLKARANKGEGLDWEGEIELRVPQNYVAKLEEYLNNNEPTLPTNLNI